MRNPNGFGTIIKLSGNRRRPYAIRITIGWNGDKQKYKYLSYHEKKTDAIIALSEYNKNPYDIDASRITFADIYKRLIENEFNDLSANSLANYKSAYKHCKPLYNKVFKELKKAHLQGVIDDIEAKSMAKVVKMLFLKMYKYGLENDIVTTNYAQYVTLPKKQKTNEKIPFSNEEITHLWNNIDTIRNADIALILLYTGMRISELLEMKKENVFLDKRYMIGGLKTEAGKDRIIPIHKKILSMIEKHYNESPCGYLIANDSGSKMSYPTFRKYYWSKFLDDSKFNHTAHDTRHTFISNMDRTGVNKVIIKRIVGHSNADITEHYTHKTIDELIEAIDKLE